MTKPRQTRTVYFQIGLLWHWRLISKWDHSLIAQGSARAKKLAYKQVQQAQTKHHENHDSN